MAGLNVMVFQSFMYECGKLLQFIVHRKLWRQKLKVSIG